MKPKLLVTGLAITAVLAISIGAFRTTAAQSQSAAQHAPRNQEEFDKLFKANNNWGRWGKDDERGAVNLITPAKMQQAAALVKNGISVSLGRGPMEEVALDNPVVGFQHVMRGDEASSDFRGDSYLFKEFHGVGSTHMDGLCHVGYKGMLYNGIPIGTVTAKGCTKLGIQNLKNGVVTRAVLIDIPRLRGVPWLEPATPVYPEEVDAWLNKQGLKVSAGDAVILNTGRWARRAKLGAWKRQGNSAGFHASIAMWFKAHDIAIAGTDGGYDVQPSGVVGMDEPLHQFAIAGLGMVNLDSQDLQALVETAAKLNRWEFMLVVAPIPVTGGTGGPINAIAIF